MYERKLIWILRRLSLHIRKQSQTFALKRSKIYIKMGQYARGNVRKLQTRSSSRIGVARGLLSYTTKSCGVRHDYDIEPNERSIRKILPSQIARDWTHSQSRGTFGDLQRPSTPWGCRKGFVRRLSQLNMKLRKPDWKSLVRLILQVDPKMEIGYFEVELGRDELGAGIPQGRYSAANPQPQQAHHGAEKSQPQQAHHGSEK